MLTYEDLDNILHCRDKISLKGLKTLINEVIEFVEIEATAYRLMIDDFEDESLDTHFRNLQIRNFEQLLQLRQDFYLFRDLLSRTE